MSGLETLLSNMRKASTQKSTVGANDYTNTRSKYSVKGTHAVDGSLRYGLGPRPETAPTLLEEFQASTYNPIHLVIQHRLSPGDVLMLTALIRDVHTAYPGMFVTDVRTTSSGLFEHNPYITKLHADTPGVLVWEAKYDLIHKSNEANVHFVYGFHDDFERVTGLRLHRYVGKPVVYLSGEDKGWYSRVHEIKGKDLPYWIINAGRKNDFTAKLWDVERYQQIVDAFPDILFVQVGLEHHYHPPLKGDNVINEVGKTNDIRQFVRLMYHAYGVITPVSFAMHLSAAVEPKPIYKYKHRPTIVLAGSREPSSWEAYSNQQYLHNCGMLPCAADGACWKSRIEPLYDGDEKDKSLCTAPVALSHGQVIPKCMDMIKAETVIDLMQQYMTNFKMQP